LKDYDNALKDYDKAIGLGYKTANAFNNRGAARSNMNDEDNAIKDYTEAIGLDAKYALAFRNRGNSWYRRKEYAKAVKDFDEAGRLDPKDDRAFERKAWVLATCPDAKVRDGKRAVVAATTACKLNDWKKADDLDTLAAAYAEEGDFANAVKWEEKALEDKDFARQNANGAPRRLQLYKDHKPCRVE
jgi:tetratricopeptide (TPR) repeat protein